MDKYLLAILLIIVVLLGGCSFVKQNDQNSKNSIVSFGGQDNVDSKDNIQEESQKNIWKDDGSNNGNKKSKSSDSDDDGGDSDDHSGSDENNGASESEDQQEDPLLLQGSLLHISCSTRQE